MEHASPSASSAGPRSAEEVFLAVIERPASERTSYLAAVCGVDASLRAEVEMLVACHDEAGEFLEHSPGPGSMVVDDVDWSRVPERIGKFEIRGVLGTGGMGCVYLAESAEPRRQVALKVIRPGFGTPEMMRRFRHEVQVVAVLKHPAVAVLHEAGVEQTPGGPVPWFAMEYVEGPTLTAYVKEREQGWRERMALVARVALGVHHAHQKGIIHRDLKPGNILVDASGQPKILDFGVARLVEGSEGIAAGGEHGQTMPGQMVGTLAYMSPEQLSGDSGAVDARSDIYSLGLVLYEVLAGTRAYDVGSAPLADALRIIRETTPRRLGDIDRRLRGDAEAVVETAMAKEPERRYQSAAELAADIARCLADQPVLARRATAGYHLRKFAKRHRVLVAAATVALASLVGGLGVSVWKGVEARDARDAERDAKEDAFQQATRAVAAKVDAEEQAVVADASAGFLEGLFASADPSVAKKTDVTLREVLGRSSVEKLRERFPASPRVRVRLNGAIGRSYKSLSMLPEAEAHLVEAAATAREHLPVNSRERLEAFKDLGHLYKLQDRFEEGETYLRGATASAEAVYGVDSEVAVSCRNDLGTLVLHRGNAAEAEGLFRTSWQGAKRTLGEGHAMTLATMNNLAASLRHLGRHTEALELRREVVRLCIVHLTEDHNGTLTSMNNLAKDLMEAGEHSEAELLLRRAFAGRMKIQGPTHRSTLNTKCNLGSCLAAMGDLDGAAVLLSEVVVVAEAQEPQGTIDTATYAREYARVLVKLGRTDEGIDQFERAHRWLVAAMGEKSKQAAGVAGELAGVYEQMGDAANAGVWSERAKP
jgi:tetratricopeptide (TPR) repeat protein